MRAMPCDVEMHKVVGLLRQRETQMVQLLGRFVRCESPSDVKAAVDAFSRLVAAEWRRRGCMVRTLKQTSAGNHVAVRWIPSASRERQILVIGHLDTVYPLGTLRTMPFRLHRRRAFGPGAFDMKGGLVLALFAFDALMKLKWLPRRPVLFLWTSDEEAGSTTSRQIIEREARRSAAVLVLEPAGGTDGRLKTQRKGVGTAELIITGRAAHSGLNPEAGVNALHELALQTEKIMHLNEPHRGTTVNVTIAGGGTRSNVIPASAHATIDLRAANLTEMRRVEGKLKALRPVLTGARMKVRGGFSRPPLERAASASLFARARQLARAIGVPLRETAVGGGSDGNFTGALGITTLDGLGAVGDAAHSPDEHVVISSLPERAALLAGLLATL